MGLQQKDAFSRRPAATNNTIIIPGHGKLVSNNLELKDFRDMLVDIRDKVAALKKTGCGQTDRSSRRIVGPVRH